MGERNESKELRIVLNTVATGAFEAMLTSMREAVPTIKVQPSAFVSFLVTDFFMAHFEKDKAILIAEFFDSDGFYELARKKAKGSANYEELMAEALQAAKEIKGKKRRKPVRKGTQGTLKTEGSAL